MDGRNREKLRSKGTVGSRLTVRERSLFRQTSKKAWLGRKPAAAASVGRVGQIHSGPGRVAPRKSSSFTTFSRYGDDVRWAVVQVSVNLIGLVLIEFVLAQLAGKSFVCWSQCCYYYYYCCYYSFRELVKRFCGSCELTEEPEKGNKLIRKRAALARALDDTRLAVQYVGVKGGGGGGGGEGGGEGGFFRLFLLPMV